MNRRAVATAAAIVLAAAALWWARAREQPRAPGAAGATEPAAADRVFSAAPAPPAAPASEDEPQSVVWKMVDASKARDVAAYLDCFTGDLRARLEASVRELGEAGFADYLARRVEELKGVALYDVELGEAGAASVTIEYVFAKEKEMQRLHLEAGRGGWRIAAADESRREKSLIPYGTPIEQVE